MTIYKKCQFVKYEFDSVYLYLIFLGIFWQVSLPVVLLYLSVWNESGANMNNESGKAFMKTKEYARIKIMWEEQLVYPPIDY